jgi:hypothetical protein
VSKPAYIAEWRHPFEMTDKYGDLTRKEMRDGICYQYRAAQFKITVNGEPGSSAAAIIRGVVLESFDVVGRSTGPAVAYSPYVACDDYPYETSWLLPSITTGLLLPRPALTK